jgi:hypothetical protein
VKKSILLGLGIAYALTFTIPSIAAEDASEKMNVPQLSGFECASELLKSIDLLGRGSDFPAFLVRDVSTELKRQDNRSHLISVECVAEPTLKASSKPLVVNGKEQNVLTKLSMTFPLQLKVKNGKSEMMLNVDQNYMVENMDQPGQQKVTQNFIVQN